MILYDMIYADCLNLYWNRTGTEQESDKYTEVRLNIPSNAEVNFRVMRCEERSY